MIGTIRKHSKVLWIVVIIVTITTFLYWGGQGGRNHDQGGRAEFGTIDGRRITREEVSQAVRETQLYMFFRTGQWPDNNDQLMPQAYQRLLLISMQKQMGVKVDAEAVAKAADQYLRMLNQGNPVPFDSFEKQFLQPHNVKV